MRLLKLMTFLSPAFPVGGFAYSHGLEWAIENARVSDAGSLQAWMSDILEIGSGWNDAVLLAAAWRAASAGDCDALREAAELGEALAGSRERQVEMMQQGRAFVAAVASAWHCEAAARLLAAGNVPLPIGVAAAAAEHAIPLDEVLPAYLNAFASNLVSVAVRLVPLGQTAGLKVLAALHPLISSVAARAARSTLDDLGSSAILSDIASMRHEQQYSRVFRT